MALIQRKTSDERAQAAAVKEQQRREADARRRADQLETIGRRQAEAGAESLSGKSPSSRLPPWRR